MMKLVHRLGSGGVRRWFALSFCLSLSWVAAGVGSAQQPSVAELARQLEKGDRDARREAARALSELGAEAKEALPQLIRGAQDRDPQIWQFSVLALDRLGSEAADAVPVLLKQLDVYQPQRRYRVSVALGHIGQPAVAGLTESLEAKKAQVRAAAAGALGVMGEEASSAAEPLSRLLGDRDETVRQSAADALGRIGDAALPYVKQQLGADSASIRSAAALAAQSLGKKGAPLQPQLQRLVGDGDRSVRVAALKALVAVVADTTLDQDGSEYDAVLLRALQDEDSAVRRAALNAIAAASEGSRFVPGLLDLLNDEEVDVSRSAVFLLGCHGAGRADVIERLIDLASSRPQMQEEIKNNLVRMGRSAVAPLLAALPRHPEVSSMLAEALAEIGGVARSALLEALESQDPAVRASAAAALGRLPVESATWRKLMQRLEDDSALVRAAVIEAGAANMARLTIEQQSAILRLAGDDDREVRRAVAGAIGALDPNRKEIERAAAELLRDRDPDVRLGVLETLTQWDELPESLSAALVGLLDDSTTATRATLLRLAVRHSALRSAAEERFRRIAGEAARSKEVQLRLAAAVYWGTLASRDGEAQRELARLVGDSQESVVVAALAAVPRLENESGELWSAVEGRVAKGSEAERVAAISALGRVSRSVEKRLEVLLTLLRDDRWAVRNEACRAVGGLGEAGKPAVPELLKLLRSQDDQEAARQALQRIGTAGAEAVPQLRELLRSRNPRRRAYAVYLLGRVEPAPVEMLGELRGFKGKGDERFERLLQSTIDRIERAAKSK